jgi:hypothetical protein
MNSAQGLPDPRISDTLGGNAPALSLLRGPMPMRSDPILLFSSERFDAALMSDLLVANATRVVHTLSPGEALKAINAGGISLGIVDANEPEREWRPVRDALRGAGVPCLVLRPKTGEVRGLPVDQCVSRPIDTVAFPRTVLNAIRGETTGRVHVSASFE